MTARTVRVVAHVTALAGHEQDLATVLRALVAPTRAEAGCIGYELLQDRDDPAAFVFVEEWMDDAAIATHMGAEHVRQAFAQAAPLLAQAPRIRSFRLLD